MDTFDITYDTSHALHELAIAVEKLAHAHSPHMEREMAPVVTRVRRHVANLNTAIQEERDRLSAARPQLGNLDFKTGRRWGGSSAPELLTQPPGEPVAAAPHGVGVAGGEAHGAGDNSDGHRDGDLHPPILRRAGGDSHR